MSVVAGEVPFEYIIKRLIQDSSESAGFNVRVSALNRAGYGPPSTVLNLKVRKRRCSGFPGLLTTRLKN